MIRLVYYYPVRLEDRCVYRRIVAVRLFASEQYSLLIYYNLHRQKTQLKNSLSA